MKDIFTVENFFLGALILLILLILGIIALIWDIIIYLTLGSILCFFVGALIKKIFKL